MTARARAPTVGPVNVAASVPATAARLGTKIALRLDDHGLSYRRLEAGSARVAALLRGHGIAPGERVALMVPNVPEVAVVFYGILRAGAVVVALDPSLGESDVAAALADVRLLFAWHAVAETAEAGARRAATPCLFVTPGELGRLLRGLPAQRAVRERDDADLALILDGSGRGLTHGELAAAAAAVVREQALTENDVALCSEPLFRGAEQIGRLHATVCVGGSLSLEAAPMARA
jgi:long-chain acyl-CoA synthetase